MQAAQQNDSYCLAHGSEAGILWWRQPGYWHYRMNRGHQITDHEVLPYLHIMAELRPGRRAPLLLDRSNPYSATFEAMETLRCYGPGHCNALAIFAPTVMAKMAAQVAINHYDTFEHTTIRHELHEAENWIRQFVADGSHAYCEAPAPLCA